jgi:histone H3/H4
MYVSSAVVRKILKEAGAGRISNDAVAELQKYVNTIAFETAAKAVKLSKHAKRKTIEVSDIKLAMRE